MFFSCLFYFLILNYFPSSESFLNSEKIYLQFNLDSRYFKSKNININIIKLKRKHKLD